MAIHLHNPRRRVAAATALLVAAGSLASCSSDGGDGVTADGDAADGGTPDGVTADGGTADGGSEYPSGDIEFIIPWDAGGSSDLAARQFITHFAEEIGTSVTPINRPGANGAIGWEALAASEPDGNTLGLLTYDVLTNEVASEEGTALEDLDVLMQFEQQPLGVYVPGDSPFETLEDLRGTGSEVTVGTSGLGGVFHQASAALGQALETEWNYVPFDGSGGQMTSILGGSSQLIVTTPTAPAEYVEDGSLRLIGVFGDEPMEQYPDVPTLSEAGLDVPPIGSFRGVGAPAGLDDDVREALEEALKATYESEDFQADAEEMQMMLQYRDAEDFRTYLEELRPVIRQVIEDLGLAVD